MEAIAIIDTLVLFIIAIELGIMLLHREDEETKGTSNPRRELNGTFRDPFGDKYRTNKKGLYVPIRPGGKMLDEGDEDDDL